MPLHSDDLNKAWVCHKCNSLFIFRSDVELHSDISGHQKFAVFDLATGKLVKNNETARPTRDNLS